MKTSNVITLILCTATGFGLIFSGEPITKGIAFAILISCALYPAVTTFRNTNVMVERKKEETVKQTYSRIASSASPSKTALNDLIASVKTGK